MTDKETNTMLGLYYALVDAENHLDFCGYGDSYERGCARDEGLPQKIEKSLSACRDLLGIPEEAEPANEEDR